MEVYKAAMNGAFGAFSRINSGGPSESKSSHEAGAQAQYCLPLGTLCRSLFKMDFAEALYIAELRSGAAGHFSYRRVAWEMYQAIATRYPALAPCFRVSDINEPADFLER